MSSVDSFYPSLGPPSFEEASAPPKSKLGSLEDDEGSRRENDEDFRGRNYGFVMACVAYSVSFGLRTLQATLYG